MYYVFLLVTQPPFLLVTQRLHREFVYDTGGRIFIRPGIFHLCTSCVLPRLFSFGHLSFVIFLLFVFLLNFNLLHQKNDLRYRDTVHLADIALSGMCQK